jgi:hypothetical protein
MAYLVECMHRVAVASVDHVSLRSNLTTMQCYIRNRGGGGIREKRTLRLWFTVLIAKAFNRAHKQQQETGIRDLGHNAALLPVVGLPPDSYTQ